MYSTKGECRMATKPHICDIPELLVEWNWEKNSKEGYSPYAMTAGANRQVHWICHVCGYEWLQTPNHRSSRKSKCPQCTGRVLIEGINDLATMNPNLAAEWDYEKNGALRPTQVKPFSNKSVWWQCKNGHSWKATISNRSNGNGCSECGRQQSSKTRIKNRIKEKGSFASNFPSLAPEWDMRKNHCTPDDVTAKSNQEVWWQCSKGHSYPMRISHRASGHGCPFCAGVKVFTGESDFETWCKENGRENLLEEWDETSTTLKPCEVSRSSKESIRWICGVCGYSWTDSICARVRKSLCPQCQNRSKTSFPEQTLLYYLGAIFDDVVSRYSEKANAITEIDIYIPSIRTGIEYDGLAWHKGSRSHDREKEKYERCKNAGIRLIRVREQGLPMDDDTCDAMLVCPYNNFTSSEFSNIVKTILNLLSPNNQIEVDVQKDRNSIFAQYYTLLQSCSLSDMYPDIAKEWHPSMNGEILPRMVPAYSNDPFFFLCECGHTYECVVAKRTKRGDGCPYCSGHRVLAGYNDLQTTHPLISAEWDFDRNGGVLPTMVSKGYDKKVWWKCINGHSFSVSPNTRTSQNVGCSKCNGGVPKKVAMYDLQGRFVGEFVSVASAGANLSVTPSAILRACKHATPCKGYLFEYVEGTASANILPYKKHIFNNRPVKQYSLTGEYIATYESMVLAVQATGAAKISEVCNGKRKSSGGFIWRFAEKE